MLNKQKTKMVWCTYSGRVNTRKKLIRCPKCNKRLMVFVPADDVDEDYREVSRHKRKVKDISYD
jgi:hypothetical protein